MSELHPPLSADRADPADPAVVTGGTRVRSRGRASDVDPTHRWPLHDAPVARRFAAFGVLCLAVFSTQPLPEALRSGALAGLGLGTCVATFLGLRLHRPHPAWPWRALGVAAVAFLAGALARPFSADRTGAAMATADAFTVPGYLLLIVALAGLLRARRALDVHALLDGIATSIGAALLSLTFFAMPAAEVSGRPAWVSALAAVYPVLDVVLLLLLLAMAFTTAVSRPSYRLLAAGIVLVFLGDIFYAFIGRRGELLGSWWMDLPFLGAYLMLGLAVLHPSMAELTRIHPRPVQAWSARRLTLVCASLAVPFVLLVLRPPETLAVRLVYAGSAAAMVVTLLVRAVTAVRAYAKSERDLRHQATHDALTGLVNREQLVGEIARMLADRRTVGLLFLDLDGFKLVNDNWGHGTGDELLVQVAGRLRATARRGDILARIGGDEFVVAGRIGDGPEPQAVEEAGVLADRVRHAFAAPFVVSDAEVYVTPSMGVTIGAAGSSAEGMVRDGDTAMYRAKSGGRDRTVIFDASMRESVRARVEMELALRHAVARDQFSLVFMPVVELRTEQLLGFEALLRWDHPKLGAVSPVDFVPVAEDTGLIVPIGGWVLRAAAAQLAQWRDEHAHLAEGPRPLTLSVNVSARQLHDGGLVETVTDVLASTGLPASCLCLEITESAILTETETAEEALSQLATIGISLSVDDFGTGYSSLGYLRRFPVDEVKIDREFVAGLGRDSEDEEIVRAVTAMGHALGLVVVAEGVETRGQRDMLRVFGVDRAQGWCYGKAVPASDVVLPPPPRAQALPA